MKKFLFFLLILSLSLVLCLVLFGFIFIRSNSAKDLGIRFSQEDLQRVDEKYGFKSEELSGEANIIESKVFEGSVGVDDYFTDEEMTAQADKLYRTWKYFPVKNVQIRVNEDGSVESSGVFIVDRTYPYFEYVGVSKETVDKGLEYINLLGSNEIPVYAKGRLEITNNDLNMEIENIKVGYLPIPQGIIEQYGGLAEEFAQSRIDNIANLNIEEARFEDGKVYIKGDLVETIKAVK